ncbi:peptide deformylase, mitochondrial-like [Odontomachus brunneus]|uniref:peptide deformylase, mitochondrial-like n=1 Tax=Odontomachus brunneus TaxID=486640 RepID=UPI0013F227A5|nr:peptide deformylase, mitochondrial-like [Odontomachus brunneus]
MFRVYNYFAVTLRVIPVRKNNIRFISFLKIKETFKNWLGMDSGKLPYKHVCQIGDPVLRGHALTVEPEVIKLKDFQKIIKHLISVMRIYGACGLSGPQIGLPWQIFAIEFTEEHMQKIDVAVRKTQEIKIVPTQIFINPQLKITNHTSIAFYEVCESIRGYSAVVPRAYEVEIKALDASAQQFTWKACGWPARMAQHEFDHLQGKLYVDKMDMSTFHCTAWEKINRHGGKVRLEYMP